jgi:hypothetical protein
MKTRLILAAFCAALLLPGVVAAKKPPAPEPDPGCVVLPVGFAYTGQPLTIRVDQDPAYPASGWVSPTVTGFAVFPMPKRSPLEQTAIATDGRLNVEYVDLPFTVPTLDTGIRTITGRGNSKNKQVYVDVIVEEQTTNGTRTHTCSGSVGVYPSL